MRLIICIHDPAYLLVHGDLKQRNVLLGDALVIKLADFGATFLAEQTGAINLTTSGRATQHTSICTAPEFLRDINGKKTLSMDVYSYGIMGYEIITRKRIFFKECQSVMTFLIANNGQKPNEKFFDKIADALLKNIGDTPIFLELKKTVYQ